MFRTLVRLSAAAAVAAASVLPAAGPSHAAADPAAGSADTVTWSLVPADAEGRPDGRQSFRLAVDPGASVTEHAVLTNYSDRAVAFELTASDGVIAEDGSFDILQGEEEAADSGAWIALTDRVEVGPESSVLVPFRVDVPADALPGDHPAGITAGVSAESAGGDAGVGLQARVGLRLHLRVSGEVAAAVGLSAVAVRYAYSWNPFAPGRAEVTYEVANTGNVRVGTTQRVTAAGPFGAARQAAGPAEPRETLPRTSHTVTTVVEDVWPLARLGASVTATPAAVGSDDLGEAALATASATAATWAPPWPQLVPVLLVVAAVVLLRRARARRRAAFARALADARAEGAAAGAPV